MLFSEMERLLRLLVAQGEETERLTRILVALAQENNTLALAQLNETRILESRVRSIEHDVSSIKRGVRDIEQDIDRILDILASDTANSLKVTFTDLKGNDTMASTVTLQVGQTTTATAHEFSGLAGAGVELPLAGPIAWASSDSAVATVDAASGLVTAVAAGTATITGTDPVNGLSGDGIVSDTPLVAQSLTVDFGPVA